MRRKRFLDGKLNSEGETMSESQAEYGDRRPNEKEGKLAWNVFPFPEAEEVCSAFVYGAEKYGGPFTYRRGIPIPEIFAKVIRHLVEIQRGVIYDPESGCLHWAHVAANALMAIAQYRQGHVEGLE